MTQWYYMQDGQSVGPVSDERIKQLTDAGILTSDSAVRSEEGEWQRIVEVPVLRVGSDMGSTRSSGAAMKYVLAAIGLVIVLAAVGFIGFNMMSKQSEPVPTELVEFRDSLIKLRSDLKLGMSDREYHDALKSQQFAADKAAAIQMPEEHSELYGLLSSAFDEYLAAQVCIEYLNNPELLPEYRSVAEIEAGLAELDKQI